MKNRSQLVQCQNCISIYNILADSVRLDYKSVEDIYINSKEVMTMVGEWELTGVTAKQLYLQAGDGKMYDELRFHVSLPNYCLTVHDIISPGYSGFI